MKIGGMERWEHPLSFTSMGNKKSIKQIIALVCNGEVKQSFESDLRDFKK